MCVFMFVASFDLKENENNQSNVLVTLSSSVDDISNYFDSVFSEFSSVASKAFQFIRALF